jgi:hypothetical protein
MVLVGILHFRHSQMFLMVIGLNCPVPDRFNLSKRPSTPGISKSTHPADCLNPVFQKNVKAVGSSQSAVGR